MLIVIEGPNRSGKSYLISQLKHLKRIPDFFHIDPPVSETRKYIYDFLALVQYMNKRNTFIITERHPIIQDLVKSEILDREPSIAWEDLSHLKKQDISGYVYCRPDPKILQGNLSGMHRVPHISENLPEIVRIYDRFFTQDLPKIIPRITYNYSEDNISKVVRFINHVLSH